MMETEEDFKQYLLKEGTSPENLEEIMEWFRTRPPHIKKLALKYPPGYKMEIEGQLLHVIGYQEAINGQDDMLIISPHDPHDCGPEEFNKDKEYICVHHLETNH